MKMTNSFKKLGKTILLLKENKHQDKKLPPPKVGNSNTSIPMAIFRSLSRREYILSLFNCGLHMPPKISYQGGPSEKRENILSSG
jgi:hypothetical protein